MPLVGTASGLPLMNRVDLSLAFAEELGEAFEPYERLLHQAMLGNSALFSREDLVEQTWRVVQPLIDRPPPVLPYGRGSMGPDAADELVRDLRNFRGAPVNPRHPLGIKFVPVDLRDHFLMLKGPEGQMLYHSPNLKGESIVLTRDEGGGVNAFYNVVNWNEVNKRLAAAT